MGLFKSSDELLEKGLDLVEKKEFAKAQDAFEKSAEKAEKKGEKEVLVLSKALASIMALSGQGRTYQNLINAQQALAPLGEKDIKIGLKTIKASVLVTECAITAEELSVQGVPTTSDALVQRAGRLQSIGVKFQTQIGNEALFQAQLRCAHHLRWGQVHRCRRRTPRATALALVTQVDVLAALLPHKGGQVRGW